MWLAGMDLMNARASGLKPLRLRIEFYFVEPSTGLKNYFALAVKKILMIVIRIGGRVRLGIVSVDDLCVTCDYECNCVRSSVDFPTLLINRSYFDFDCRLPVGQNRGAIWCNKKLERRIYIFCLRICNIRDTSKEQES